MKLRILLNLGRGLPNYKQGDVVEESDHDARRLLALGVAEVIEEPVIATAKLVERSGRVQVEESEGAIDVASSPKSKLKRKRSDD